jgi:AP2-associated kinase
LFWRVDLRVLFVYYSIVDSLRTTQAMSSFLGNFSHSIGQSFGNSIGHSIGHSLNTSAPEELRVGSNYVLVREKVAEGGFGVIELVVDTFTQQKEMILKRCNVDRPEVFEIVKKEINILQKFKSPYIVSLIDNDVAMRNSSREAYILLEYCPGGHLLSRLNERHGQLLPAESIYRIFGQVLLGMKSLHESRPPIIHRDIKLENILFGTDGKVRLCDFGSCLEAPILLRNVEERNKAEESIAKETTQMYRAPEMVDLYMRNQLTEKTDIWALGCVFFALSFLKHPFQDAGSLGILAGKYTIPAHSSISEDATIVLKRMLDIPEARPTIFELLLAMREVSKGSPLPPYELSAEALQRRAERIAADEVRKIKAKKKPNATPIDTKRSAPPSANSVAAKRLAAKRGVSVDANDNSLILDPSSSFQEDLFSSSSVGTKNAAFSPGNDAADFGQDIGFDPFDGGHADHHSSSGGSAVDAWDATPATNLAAPVRRPSFSTNDDAFAPTGSSIDHNAKSDTFDPFANESSHTAAVSVDPASHSDGFDPFAPSDTVTATSSAFFDDNSFQPTQPTSSVASALFDTVDDIPAALPTTAVKPNRPSFSNEGPDGFDMFDNSISDTPLVASTVTATAVAQQDNDLFDPPTSTPAKRQCSFTATVSANESFFDPFEPSSASKPAAVSQNLSARNSFSNPTTSTHPSSTSNSAHQLHDLIFASSAPLVFHSSTTISSSTSAFDALPTTPLEPVRAAPIAVATHDLLEMSVHHSSTSTSTFASTAPSGRTNLGPADVLSLYDAPKSEAPLKPVRATSVKSMPFGDDLLPPPQALGYVPRGLNVGLGGGWPMPSAPTMSNMGGPMGMGMGGGMNYTQLPTGAPMTRPLSSTISSHSSSISGGRLNMNMNNYMNSSGNVVGSYRSVTADPFDSLNQFKK